MNRSLLFCLGLSALATIPTHMQAVAQSTVPAPTEAREASFQPTQVEVGDALMAHQRYQAALEAYMRAPGKSAEAWNKMGLAYQLMFNTDQAEHCYQKAQKLNPRNGSYMNNLGSIYMERKEYSRAERAFRKALKVDAESALFEKNLGTALLAARKYPQGWLAYQRALALDPNIFDRSRGGVRVENPASIHERGAMNFYLAKGCVRAGMLVKALDYLRLSINEGFTNPKQVIADREFAALLDLPAFQEMIQAQSGYVEAASARVTVLHP